MDTHLVTHTLNRGEGITKNRLSPNKINLNHQQPHRYTRARLLSLKDAEYTVSLLIELVKKLDKKTVDGFTDL